MSRAKNIARAKAGFPHRNPTKTWICANCHDPLGADWATGKDGYLYHQGCPGIMIPTKEGVNV